jgi:asparagine synthase (glutamine-hydrolysing)
LKTAVQLRLPYTRKALTAWDHAQGSSIERLVKQVSLYSENLRSEVYTDDFRKTALANGPTHSRIEKYVPRDISNPLDRMFAFEFRIRLQSGYLRKVDITSSAHGLETRVPFLDNRMLEFSEMLPLRFKVNGHQLKYLAYCLAQRYLPKEITARTKHGFNFPFDRWSSSLSNQKFLYDLIFSPHARWREFLQPNFIDESWTTFTKQRSSALLSRMGAYARIYSLTSFELWLQKWQLSM